MYVNKVEQVFLGMVHHDQDSLPQTYKVDMILSYLIYNHQTSLVCLLNNKPKVNMQQLYQICMILTHTYTMPSYTSPVLWLANQLGEVVYQTPARSVICSTPISVDTHTHTHTAPAQDTIWLQSAAICFRPAQVIHSLAHIWAPHPLQLIYYLNSMSSPSHNQHSHSYTI